MEALRKRFIRPDAEFSPIPFWFLNGNLTKEEMRRQLLDFKAHGVYGVALHPRMGLDPRIAYLSDTYMELMAYAVSVAREEGMRVILYDEAMYPSGSACGLVVRENAAYASRGIFLSQTPDVPENGRLVARIAVRGYTGKAFEEGSARLLAQGEAAQTGETALYIIEDFTRGTIRGVHVGEDDGEENAPASTDLLNPEAVDCFIRITHERYYAAMKEDFGKTVIAMFTDEPHPAGRGARRGMKAWTAGLEDEWLAMGQKLESLCALFLEAGEESKKAKIAYDRLIDNRLARVYYGRLRAWCDAHDIALTGHPAHADSIGLESCFTIPGQDLVWRFIAPGETSLIGPESTQGKCASDSARHARKRRNLNEAFGCCGPKESQWGMTVADMKWMMDYLFVRGANLIVPHAFFYAVDTRLQSNERPPDVGPNNYWWPHFAQIASYISRLCMINTDGVNQARVAVLSSSEHLSYHLPAQLFTRQVEFNYLEIADLARAQVEDGLLCVADQRYSVIALEEEALLTPQVRALLEACSEKGVHVLLPGEGGRSCAADIAQEIEQVVSPTIRLCPAGADIRVSHICHGDAHVFFITNEGNGDYAGTVSLSASGACERWDAWTGEMQPMGTCTKGLALQLHARESVLYVVSASAAAKEAATPAAALDGEAIDLSGCFTLTLPDGTKRAMETLRDWQTIAGLETYNGTLTYEATFTLETLPQRSVIALGDVREMACVSVNGAPESALLIAPFEADVTKQLRVGDNRVCVKVTSARVTHFDGLAWPCGLMGPVTLKRSAR